MSDGLTYISVQQFCSFHGCDTIIVEEFIEHGIVQVAQTDDAPVIPVTDVPRAERALRLHRDLGVNAAGIDIILNLLDRLESGHRSKVEEY